MQRAMSTRFILRFYIFKAFEQCCKHLHVISPYGLNSWLPEASTQRTVGICRRKVKTSTVKHWTDLNNAWISAIENFLHFASLMMYVMALNWVHVEARGHGDFIAHSCSTMKEKWFTWASVFFFRYSARDLYQSEDKHFTSSLDSKYNPFKRVSHHRPLTRTVTRDPRDLSPGISYTFTRIPFYHIS